MLGRYYRDEFDALVHAAEALGHRVKMRKRTEVTDLVAGLDGGIRLTTEHGDVGAVFDKVILATGHSFPQDAETRRYFPSLWSGLVDAVVPACRVGVLGTSLSAIDASMAVATQHGRFVGISWTGADAAGGIGDQWFALSMRTRVIYAANDLDFFSFTCEQLADPEWKGRVCIRSGQHPYNTALFSALVSHQDAAATEGWLTGLKFNLARKTGGGDRDGAKDILGGICDIAVASSYVG